MKSKASKGFHCKFDHRVVSLHLFTLQSEVKMFSNTLINPTAENRSEPPPVSSRSDTFFFETMHGLVFLNYI